MENLKRFRQQSVSIHSPYSFSGILWELLSELTGGAAVFERGHMDVKKADGAFNSPVGEKKSPNDAIIQESASRQSPVKLWKALFVVLISLNAIQQFSMQNIRA